ncbi:MAG: deoxyribonuclease IV, partial [Candidatus Babeliales bacterium]
QKTLLEELNRCDILNIPYLVLHPGSRLHEDEEICIQRIATTINIIFETYKGKTTLLLENAAGQGSSVGYTLEQLSSILHLVKHQHAVGICFDSCHAHAAGYDLRTPHLYHTFWKTFDSLIGIKKLKVIHLSNSKKKCGSRVDRHEFIDKGTMPQTTFSLIMNDPRFVPIPKILETPAIELSDYAKDMTYLKKLLS